MITAKEQIGVMHGWLWIRGKNERHCAYILCVCVCAQSTGVQPLTGCWYANTAAVSCP